MKCINCKHNKGKPKDFMSSTDCKHQEECMSGKGTDRLKFEPIGVLGSTDGPAHDA